MPGFVKKFIAEWRRLGIDDSETVVAGVSGGADSCALLCTLAELQRSKKLGNKIIAAHFNHGLRGTDSNDDERFTKQLAEHLGVGFQTTRADPQELTENLEQSARRARYRYLKNVAESEDSRYVLTGHTLNDQAETFLMNMIRGSGYDGLSAIPVERPISPSSDVNLLRPLLRWANRSATVEFCEEMKIGYRNDEMNDNILFSRVRIRKELLPLLQDFNPKIVDALVRNAETALETRFTVQWLIANNAGFQAMVTNERLRVADVVGLPPELRRTAIREWLRTQLGSLKRVSTAHIDSVISLACSRKSGKSVELPGGLGVDKQFGALEVRAKQVEKTNTGDYN